MIERLSNRIADFYVQRNIVKPEDREVYECGVALILNDVVTFALIIVMSAVLWRFQYAVEFLLTFCLTRTYCGGYHAPKAYLCRLTMLLTFALVVLASFAMQQASPNVVYILMAFSFLLILPFIPVKHPNKVLTPELRQKGMVYGSALYFGFGCISVAVLELASRLDGTVIALSLCAVSALVVIGTIFNTRGCNE